jgi:2-oxoglutarate ferredoxin oxidoreductase subunit alpha
VRDARAAGIKAGFFRPVTLWPFPDKDLESSLKHVKTVLVPEVNCGQMVLEVERAVHGKAKVILQSLVNGELFKPSEIFARIKEVC